MLSNTMNKAPCQLSAALYLRKIPTRRLISVLVKAENRKKIDRPEKILIWKAAVKPALLVAVSNVIIAAPAFAEAGKLFDFNLTLPIMAGQFLLLMVILEKTWFTPVGKVLDDRDKKIRDMLAQVADNSEEIENLNKKAIEILREARGRRQKLLSDTRAECNKENNLKYEGFKEKIDKEISDTMAELEKEKEMALSDLEGDIENLSEEIIKKIIPQGVKV